MPAAAPVSGSGRRNPLGSRLVGATGAMMVAGRGAELLRPATSSGRATFLELFFDLAFVFALTRVSQRFAGIASDTGWALVAGLGRTLLLFLALWLVWSHTTWITSRYEPERSIIQAVVVGTMFASLVMAVTLPRAMEERALPFAVAYLVVMVVRPLVIVAALRGHPRRLVGLRLAAWAAAAAPLWLVGALGPDRLRLPLWAAALAVDYLAWALGWPLPRIGAAAVNRWRIAGEHLAERHQQIFLIALGESISVIGSVFSGVGYSAERAAAFGIAFATSALLWRIYFHRAGRLLTEALDRARMPGRLGAASERTHALIVLSVLVTAVGYELVIGHPYGQPRPTWLLFVVGGPVLFLVARVRLEYEIFGRISWSRMIGLVALLLVATVLARWAPMVGLSVVAGVLALVAVFDALRSRRRPPEDPAPPIGRETPGGHGSEA